MAAGVQPAPVVVGLTEYYLQLVLRETRAGATARELCVLAELFCAALLRVEGSSSSASSPSSAPSSAQAQSRRWETSAPLSSAPARAPRSAPASTPATAPSGGSSAARRPRARNGAGRGGRGAGCHGGSFRSSSPVSPPASAPTSAPGAQWGDADVCGDTPPNPAVGADAPAEDAAVLPVVEPPAVAPISSQYNPSPFVAHRGIDAPAAAALVVQSAARCWAARRMRGKKAAALAGFRRLRAAAALPAMAAAARAAARAAASAAPLKRGSPLCESPPKRHRPRDSRVAAAAPPDPTGGFLDALCRGDSRHPEVARFRAVHPGAGEFVSGEAEEGGEIMEEEGAEKEEGGGEVESSGGSRESQGRRKRGRLVWWDAGPRIRLRKEGGWVPGQRGPVRAPPGQQGWILQGARSRSSRSGHSRGGRFECAGKRGAAGYRGCGKGGTRWCSGEPLRGGRYM